MGYVGRKEDLKSALRRLRRQTIALFGGECVCCGTSIFEFLQFHHLNGGGSTDRKNNGNSAGFYYRILRDPPTDIVILCANCHNSITSYGFCPCQKWTV